MFKSHIVRDGNAIISAEDAGKVLVKIAAQTPDAALEQLQSSADGLSNREADERLEKYGDPILSRMKPATVLCSAS